MHFHNLLRWPLRRRTSLFAPLVFVLVVTPCAFAAPFTPALDSEVVEKLPLSATDPSVRRVDSLRKQLAARPDDLALRVEIAQRYFDLSMAQGDPRYVGYASAAVAPLEKAPPENSHYWLVRGMLLQYNHHFDAALQSLAKAAALDPKAPAPLSWAAAVYMVQARYPEALAECARLTPIVDPLTGTGCTAYVRATTGDLAAAYAALRTAVDAAPNAAPDLLLWQLTRLGEMAWRLGQPGAAAQHFQRALDIGITDQFLLGVWADFLLDQKQPAEVIRLLAEWERSDILLLRLAMAGKATGDSRAAGWSNQLRDRFAAATARGDRLHEQEAARFELDIAQQPKKALELAVRNYQIQKEPRDAEILMRSALAAGQAKAAQPALAWFRDVRYEDPHMARLATQLAIPAAPGVRP
jgi:tetratricopeptide (TPR) repeat protein